jgi:hypothetical protein
VSVVLPNAHLTALVLERPWLRDAQGVAYPGSARAQTRGPWPGAVHSTQTGPLPDDQPPTWSARVDPRAWPLRAGDKLTDGARTWVIVTARLVQVPGVSAADWITCQCTLDPPEVK